MKTHIRFRRALLPSVIFSNNNFSGIVLVLGFALLAGFGCVETRPRLTVIQQQGTQDNACVFSLNDLPQLVQTTPRPSAPFYWGFWIFGNGEFARNPAVEQTDNLRWRDYYPLQRGFRGTSSTFIYNYPPPYNVTYYPKVLSLPRKGDDPPPQAYMLTPLSPFPSLLISRASATPTPRQQRIVGSKRIKLEHSHGYLNGHRQGNENGVFVISYKPMCIAEEGDGPGKVFLYFGSKRTGLTGAPTLFQHLTAFQSHDANYYTTQTSHSFHLPRIAPSTQFTDRIGFQFNNDYVQNVINAIGGKEPEFRLFEEVSYNMPLGANDWSYAMAVLTSSRACGPLDKSIADLLGGVATLDPTTNNYKIGNDFVVDVDTIWLKSGEPDDPNHLYITEICQCPTKGSPQFKVTFKLSYLNVGYSAATRASIRLASLDNRFSFCKLLQASDSYGPSLDLSRWDPNTLTLTFDESTTRLNGESAHFRIEGNRPGTVTFSMIASGFDNPASLATFLAGTAVAGGSIRFPEAQGVEVLFENRQEPKNSDVNTSPGTCSDCGCN